MSIKKEDMEEPRIYLFRQPGVRRWCTYFCKLGSLLTDTRWL